MTTTLTLQALVTTDTFEAATGLLLVDQSHQCHGASLALVKSGLLPPTARVARGTCKGVGGQHSWVTIGDPYDPNVLIVDPTLWSYDPKVSGIWVGTAKNGRHRPHQSGSIWDWGRPPEAVEPPIDLTPTTALSKAAKTFLLMLGPLDRRGWQVLAQAPVGGWPAAEILAAMDDTYGLRALIPIDALGMLLPDRVEGMYR